MKLFWGGLVGILNCNLMVITGILGFLPRRKVSSNPGNFMKSFAYPCFIRDNVLRGSGYLGYMDSNQGYNPYKWVICPLARVINLHITSY